MKDALGGIFGLSVLAWMVIAWFTHVITCFTIGAWGFLIAGAILFPIAIIHGTWVWF